MVWDNQGNRWEVMVVNSSNLLQADVDLRSVNGAGGTPLGIGFVSRETPNMGLSLFVPDNNIGISQQLKSRIESHNMLLIDQYVGENRDSVFTGATAADTTTVSDPTIGDILVADNGDVGYYDGTSWVVSSGGSSTWLKPELEAGNNVVANLPGFQYLRLGKTFYRTDYGPAGINSLFFNTEATDDFSTFGAGVSINPLNVSVENYIDHAYVNLQARADSIQPQLNLMKGMGDGTYAGRSDVVVGSKLGQVNFKGFQSGDGTFNFSTITSSATAVGSTIGSNIDMILADNSTNKANKLRLRLEGISGAMTLPAYGSGTSITGTANKYAAFDAAGKIIPVDVPEGTWLKPELEAGNIVITSANLLTLQDGSGDNLEIDNTGTFVEQADGRYSALRPNQVEAGAATGEYGTLSGKLLDFGGGSNYAGINTDASGDALIYFGDGSGNVGLRTHFFQAPALTYAQFGNFYLDTDQDTTGLEGYKLGLEYGKIKLLPDDTGGGGGDGNGIYSGSGNVPASTTASIAAGDNLLFQGADPNDYSFFRIGNTSPMLYVESDDGANGILSFNVNEFVKSADLNVYGAGANTYAGFYATADEFNSLKAEMVISDFVDGQTEGIEVDSATGMDYWSLHGHRFYNGTRQTPGTPFLSINPSGSINLNATAGLTGTTTNGILGFTHTGSSGYLTIQSVDERATFQGEEARIIGDTLARMTVGTGQSLIKDALVDLTAGSSDFATLDGSINEFRVGTHDIVFEGTDGFYPEWKFETPVAANDWRMWTGGVGLTLQNGSGENTIVIANGADPALSIAADGLMRGVVYTNARHDTDNVQGNYSVGDNGDFLKTYDGEFNYRDDANNSADNTSTVIVNNSTMQLPTAVGNAGKMFIVIANASTTGGTTRTISVAGGGTIEGNATLTMDNAYEVYALISTGTEYVILWNKP